MSRVIARIPQAGGSGHAVRYVILRRDGLYYTVDSRGLPCWCQWPLTEMSLSRAQYVLDAYAPSTRRSLRIVPAPRR